MRMSESTIIDGQKGFKREGNMVVFKETAKESLAISIDMVR